MPDLLNFTVPGNSMFATLFTEAEADVFDHVRSKHFMPFGHIFAPNWFWKAGMGA